MIVRKALPFTHLATLENKAMVKSIDARATLAMVSASTVRRDLGKFYLNLQDDLKAELGGIDTLVALQHDAWTTKAFQYSFVAITASYVDSNWNFREVLLSFDVLKEKHTGATFSGHMIRTLKEMGIGDKWFGTVTSDSTGTNHRMMDILSYSGRVREMQERRGDEAVIDKKSAAAMKSSCSAFPRASMRHGGYWDPEENKILCMNHHINLAVRDGFATLGVSLKTKAQQKVLDILPVPAILVQDENGREVEVDTTSWLKDDVPDSNEDPLAYDKEETQQDSPDKGKQKATEKEGSTSTRDHADGEEGDDEDGEEDDAYESSEEEEPDFGPDAEDIGSDDGGGPEAFESADKATGSTNARSHRVSAISKLEAFTISIRRGSGRRDDFRARMQKEYHRDPHLAGAPFPPKPNATRWNSHFAMIRGALKIREAIDAHCRAYIGVKGEKLGSYLLTDTEWEMLKQLRPVLKLALAATKDMEQAQGTLYKVLDHHASLRDKIKAQVRIVETDDDLDVETTAALLKFFAAMEDKLRKYRNMALRNKITLVAALLDPSNRMDLFELSYPAYTEEAEQALRDAMKELLGDEEGRQQSPPQGAASSTSSKMTALQEAKMLRMQQTEGGPRRRKDDQPDEIARYLNTNNCAWRDSDETPYKWWRDNAKEFPNLSKLARIVLAIPGTSSSVERVFSQASLFSTSKRQSLSSKALSELVSTKHWLMHGGDQLSGLSEEAIRVAESIAKLPEL
ncbi:hypothetical protein CF326_g7145 [Tilletia indica]|nr:hypothetical protein CF326_g7145 [Tilletia indica]